MSAIASPPRRLVRPDHLTEPVSAQTYGPLVADLSAKAGFAPDPQQELGLNLLFAIRADGTPACFEFCVVCCRQNLKTGLLKQAVLGWLFVTDERHVVWSSHEMSTTREAQTDIEKLITDTPMLSRQLPKTRNRGVYFNNGDEHIELADGRKVRFKARTVSGGRGLSGDKVILDEAFALTASQMGSLIPTMAARPNPQVVYASSAGKTGSEVLVDVRERGRKGTSPRIGYAEWAAPRTPCRDPRCTHPKDAAQRDLGCALDNTDLWVHGNPTTTTGRITLDTLAGFRQALPPAEFMRECLGWWEEAGDVGGPLSVLDWRATTDDESVIPIGAPMTFAFDADPDGNWSSIGVVGDRADGLRHVELTGNDDLGDDHRPGTEWLVDRLVELDAAWPGSTFAYAAGSAVEAFVPDLAAAGLDLHPVKSTDLAPACVAWQAKLRSRGVRHPENLATSSAIAGAVKVNVGDRSWVLGRRKSTQPISPVYVFVLASWVHDTSTASNDYDVADSLG